MGWLSFQLAAEEVERQLGLSWGAAQKTLLEACKNGLMEWRQAEGGPDVLGDDLMGWLEEKQRKAKIGKQPRIIALLAKMFSNERIPDDCVRKVLRADLLKLAPSLHPLDEATLKSAIDTYNAEHADPKRS